MWVMPARSATPLKLGPEPCWERGDRLLPNPVGRDGSRRLLVSPQLELYRVKSNPDSEFVFESSQLATWSWLQPSRGES